MQQEIWQELESRSELERQAREHPVRVLLGTEAKSPRKFFARIQSGIYIGVLSEGHGPIPKLACFKRGRIQLIGHDSMITALHSDSARVLFEVVLDGVFYEFAYVGETTAAIIHELGAIQIDSSGKLLRKLDADIVEQWTLQDSRTLLLIDGAGRKHAMRLEA